MSIYFIVTIYIDRCERHHFSIRILTRRYDRARAKFKRKLIADFSAHSPSRAGLNTLEKFAQKYVAARVITRAETKSGRNCTPGFEDDPRTRRGLVVARKFVTFGPPRLEFRDSFSPCPSPPSGSLWRGHLSRSCRYDLS